MSDTSVTRAVRREDVERNIPGNVLVKIPYVPVQEESTERRYISIKLPNGTKIDVTKIHITADKEKFLAHSIAADRVMQDMGYYHEAEVKGECVPALKVYTHIPKRKWGCTYPYDHWCMHSTET
jgi:hypothetical protein